MMTPIIEIDTSPTISIHESAASATKIIRKFGRETDFLLVATSCISNITSWISILTISFTIAFLRHDRWSYYHENANA